jgi:hypothetical protein
MSTLTIKRLVEDKAPVQVMFYDGENMCAGILFGEQIICGCCGGVFDIDTILENAREDGCVPIKVFETWADIGEAIEGDDAESAIPVEMEG